MNHFTGVRIFTVLDEIVEVCYECFKRFALLLYLALEDVYAEDCVFLWGNMLSKFLKQDIDFLLVRV